MNRVCGRVPALDVAFDLLSPRLRERVSCDVVIASDPVFIGLHRYAEWSVSGTVGRYRDVAHVSWGGYTSLDRRTTIVLPNPEVSVSTVLHELGHVLDEQIAFERHTPDAVSGYAEFSTWEAFADAFMNWAAPELMHEQSGIPEWRIREGVLEQDERTVALFEELAR